MKKILWLFSLLFVGGWNLSAQTVYFSQNFNSSTSNATYIGTGTNQFDGLTANGNSNINVLNNKLQIVKNGGTGTTNRAGVTKTNTPFNPTGVGGFLKFEMELTLINNTPGVNVTNGFLFSIAEGLVGTHADDPNVARVHSRLYVSPAATAGSFVIKAGGTATPTIVSEALVGTQKLVWYINNSGNPAGYNAPDGTLASVMDDSADIWTIDETGKVTLLLDEVPASAPAAPGLRQLKISTNDNFVATLEIDDIVISEEPVIMLKKITGISSSFSSVTAPVKTLFHLLPLPTHVNVTLEDGTQDRVAVRWTEIDPYNQYRLGEYQVKGDPIPNSGTINFDKHAITGKVILRADVKIVNTFSPNGDGKNDTWVIPDLKGYTQVSIEVFDRNGKLLFQTADANVGWDGKNKDGKIEPGAYFYTIKVPTLIMEKKGVLTILK